MKLQELLKNIEPVQIIGDADVEVTGVNIDSRKIKEGHLFVAMKGTQVDGHKFIPKALELGAKSVLCEDMPEEKVEGVTYIQVASTEDAVGKVATLFYGDPSRKLKLVGVTGTNGKTTIATLLYNMFRKFGHKCGLLSTVCNYIEDEAIPADHTTPDPIELNMLLGKMVEAGCEYAFMECSSHAIAQKRIGGLQFAGGLFTNLTRDHLDYHKTVDAYLKAKKRFFDLLPASAFALVNADDKAGLVMLQNTAARRLTYSLRNNADFRGRIIESRLDGTLLQLNGRDVEVMFTGGFNAYNLLDVYGASILLGFDPEKVLVCMSRLVPVAGRFQTLHSPKGYTAIVDYAHTPDALVNVLDSIREVIRNRGNIITVVGAGGNRDKGKRPIMAKEAALRSDRLILTSDNPRFEEPDDILHDMEQGLDATMAARTLKIADRREAIKVATQFAGKGDVILIAGKGHEDYQEIKGVKHHFDDKEEVEAIFRTEKVQQQ